jgi:uncharacterized protein
VITPDLINAIRVEYQLDWHGTHGARHWARVRDIGLRLAEKTGANTRVVELFAFLHDSRRFNNSHDPEHGSRAVSFAEKLRGKSIHLADEEFELLSYACQHHTLGHLEGDITVLTCWDADRLDLGRVGIMPSADKLCTAAARDKQMIEWAYGRSTKR